MAFALIFDAEAEADLAAIETYLTSRSPSGASNVLADIWKSLALLRDHPMIGRKAEDSILRLRVTRRYRYIIVYAIEGEEIQVRAIFHRREDRPC